MPPLNLENEKLGSNLTSSEPISAISNSTPVTTLYISLDLNEAVSQ